MHGKSGNRHSGISILMQIGIHFTENGYGLTFRYRMDRFDLGIFQVSSRSIPEQITHGKKTEFGQSFRSLVSYSFDLV